MLMRTARRLRGAGAFALTLLIVEFIDELAFGLRETAWPFIRADLNLSYEQIGLLIGLPAITAALIEAVMGVLSDMPGWRPRLVLGGGIAFIIAAGATALAGDFGLLMAATILFYPASGAFVSLGQATLMDTDPARHEQNMARWTFFGAVGVLAAPWLLTALTGAGATWREGYVIVAALTAIAWLGLYALRRHFPASVHEGEDGWRGLIAGLGEALRMLKQGAVVRWFGLLIVSDFMLDILLSFMALYFVDVVGVDEGGAALAITVWTGVGLIGDYLIIHLLERVNGLAYLRYSVLIELILYPAFLLVEDPALKLVILGAIGFANAGWYSVLQAQVYAALPGKSGAATTLGTLFTPIEGFIPLLLGVIAGAFGLNAAMWLLWLGPIALLLGLPRRVPLWRQPGEPDAPDAD